jgi:hypothetical protein
MRIHAGLLPLLCALSSMAFTASASGAVKQPVLPYSSNGYRYAVVSYGDLPGFEQPSFDDSSFSTGDAAFGFDGCPLESTIQTTWPLLTDLLLRKSFTLPAGASAVEVGVAIDNDIQVFVNGVDISGGLQLREGCAERDSSIFPVPDAILHFGGSNLLAVRARDRGPCCDYADVEVRAEISQVPPTISNVSATPSTLWPPNHKLVAVTVNYTVADNNGPVSATLSVTSNEPVNGLGDGDTAPDWEIVDAHHLRLRAERAGSGNGRIYTITITATGSGGSVSRQVTVSVPKR